MPWAPPYTVTVPTPGSDRGDDTVPQPTEVELWTDLKNFIDDSTPVISQAAAFTSAGAVRLPSGFTIPVCSAQMPTYMKDHANSVATALGLTTLVCTGTNDQLVINAAIQKATTMVGIGNPATAESGTLGVKVELSAGQFNVTNSVIFADKIHLAGQGMGATRIAVSNQSAWPEVTTGGTGNTFTHGRPVISIVAGNGTGPTWDTWMLTDLEVYGGGDHGPGSVCGIQIFTNSGPGGGSSSGYVAGPDNAGHIHDVAITQCSQIGLLINGPKLSGSSDTDGAPTTGGSGTDAQAMVMTGMKIFHTGWHGMVVMGADSYMSNIDVGSTGNNTALGRVSFGILAGGGGLFFNNVKSWYAKRAGVTATPTLSGSAYYVSTQKLNMFGCEAQEAFNHGFVFRNCRGQLQSMHANSCGTDGIYTDSVTHGTLNAGSNSRTTNDCAGFYFIGGNTNIIFDGHAYNQLPATPNGIAWGIRNDVSMASSFLRLAFYSQGTNTTAPIPSPWNGHSLGPNTFYWFSGDTGNSDVVQTNLTMTSTSSPVFAVYKYRNTTGARVIGTTTVEDPDQLRANVTGGAVWYRVEALVFFHADDATDAKLGLRVTQTGVTGTVNVNLSASGEDASGATKNYYGVVTAQNADLTFPFAGGQTGGLGTVSNAGQRVARFNGVIYVGGTVDTARIGVVVAEQTAGMGVVIASPSYLSVTALRQETPPFATGTVT